MNTAKLSAAVAKSSTVAGRNTHCALEVGEVAADVRREIGKVVGGPQLDAPAGDRFGVELEDAAALAERRRARVVRRGLAHGKMVVTSSATARCTS